VHRTMLVAALAFGLGTNLVAAVSADDTAQKSKQQSEKEKKAAKKKPKEGKVYTNTDLGSPTPKSSAPPATAPTSTTSTGGVAAGNIDPDTGRPIGEAASAQPDPQALLPEPHDEAGWRFQAQARRTAVQNAERRVADIEARLGALMADRSPIDVMDPNRLQTIEAEKAKARQDLEAAKAELERAKSAWSEFEETARRKGVPPRWLEPPS
jgi:hypothetical protein